MTPDTPKPEETADDRLRDVCCRRVDPAGRRRALELLLTGRLREDDHAVDQFLQFADQQKLAIEDLWQIERAGRPEAAALIVPCAGRCGMLFMSPVTARYQAQKLTVLVQAMVNALTSGKSHDPLGDMDLLQSLFDPRQRLHEEALAQAGWHRLAVLHYMQKKGLPKYRPLRLPDPSIAVTSWDEKHRTLFERAIAASYEQTLDCPGLLGLRRMTDILAGHMAAGQFCPAMWHVLHRDDEPVGVVMVNQVVGQQTAELVYLGLSPAWRGRGLSLPLMEHAMGQAHAAGARSMLLAVDQANAPAIRLYERLGFRVTGEKLAMIRTMSTSKPHELGFANEQAR